MNIPDFLKSSADPEKISLTVKSIAALLVIFGFDQAVVNDLGNHVANLFTAIAMGTAALTGIYGLARKLR